MSRINCLIHTSTKQNGIFDPRCPFLPSRRPELSPLRVLHKVVFYVLEISRGFTLFYVHLTTSHFFGRRLIIFSRYTEREKLKNSSLSLLCGSPPVSGSKTSRTGWKLMNYPFCCNYIFKKTRLFIIR